MFKNFQIVQSEIDKIPFGSRSEGSDGNRHSKAVDRLDSINEETVVLSKPRTSPTLFQPSRKFGQDVSPVDNDSKIARRKMVDSLTDSKIDIIKNQEPSPLIDSDVISEYFTCSGGIMVIKDYGLVVNVPSGAIEDHHIVEIQAAASLCGPFDIPNGYHPVSAYVWIGANYTFKKPIEIEFEHHADISNSECAPQLCILKACCTNYCTKHNFYHLKMHDIMENYVISDSFCTLYTDHFCSYCLAARSTQIPDRIVAYHYLPGDYKSVDEFIAEICFYYDLNICKKTTEKRFKERNMIKRLGLPLHDSLSKMDELHLSNPSVVNGWNVTHLSSTKMKVSEIDYRDFYSTAEDLIEDEKRDHYPPRFLTHLKCHQSSTLDVTYTLHVIKEGNVVKDYNFSIFVKASHEDTTTGKSGITEQQHLEKSPEKSPTNKTVTLSTESCHVVSPETLEQKPTMGCLVKYVIPKVKAYWVDIAYAVLNYDIPDVDAIKQKHQNDVKECCQELFKDWLTTEHGVKPKTWATLLSLLREVEELSAVVEVIEDKLGQLF